MAGRVGVLLAGGFEEIEALTVIDVLRRAEFEVVVAGVPAGPTVEGAHGVTVSVDAGLTELDAEDLALLVLPGGMPGSVNLAENLEVQQLVRDVHARGRLVAAICAAPIALHAAGILDGKRVTSYPSFAEHLTGAAYTENVVEKDGNIVTSRGPGTALEFALALVEALGRPEAAVQLRKNMLVGRPA